MFFNVSFCSTVLMLTGTLFQLIGPWYANTRCPYDLVLAVAVLRIFGSDDEHSGLAGEYTLNSFDKYFGYAVVNAVSIDYNIRLFYCSKANCLTKFSLN